MWAGVVRLNGRFGGRFPPTSGRRSEIVGAATFCDNRADVSSHRHVGPSSTTGVTGLGGTGQVTKPVFGGRFPPSPVQRRFISLDGW